MEKRIKKSVFSIWAFILIVASLTLFGCEDRADVGDTASALQAEIADPPTIEIKREDNGRTVLWDSDATPVRVNYSFTGCFTHFACATENAELINELVSALKSLKIEDKEGQYVFTADTKIELEMSDGKVYTFNFTGDNYEDRSVTTPYGYKVCETKGFDTVNAVLSKIAEKEQNQDNQQ